MWSRGRIVAGLRGMTSSVVRLRSPQPVTPGRGPNCSDISLRKHNMTTSMTKVPPRAWKPGQSGRRCEPDQSPASRNGAGRIGRCWRPEVPCNRGQEESQGFHGPADAPAPDPQSPPVRARRQFSPPALCRLWQSNNRSRKRAQRRGLPDGPPRTR